MQAFSTLTSKGQITIPKAVRETLKLKPGDTISYVPMDWGVMIVPRNRSVESVFGILEDHAIPNTTLADYDAAIRDGAAEKAKKGKTVNRTDDAA